MIVEDEYLVAFDMADELKREGAEILGPYRDVPRALAAMESTAPISCAVLDINLGAADVYPLAELLRSRGIPFVFATGYERFSVDPSFADVPLFPKPVQPGRLARVLADFQ